MYAIVSLLRRAAISVIYIRKAHTTVDGRVPIERENEIFDIPGMTWVGKEESVPMYRLSAEGSSSEEVATKLVLSENDIFKKAALEGKHYTLLLGPESEKEGPEGVIRSSRIGIVRGVLRSPSATAPLTTLKAQSRRTTKFRNLPKGVIIEKR